MLLSADVLITLGCSDACPIILGKPFKDRQIGDPGGKESGSGSPHP